MYKGKYSQPRTPVQEETPVCMPELTEEQIIAKVKADVAQSNKGQPAYRKVQNVYVSFSEFEKSSTRKVIRQKVIDTYANKVNA